MSSAEENKKVRWILTALYQMFTLNNLFLILMSF